MFASIRRHQKILWAIIITVIILSFVVFFSPDAGLKGLFGGNTRSSGLGSINGRPLSAEEYYNAKREAMLVYYLHFREWPREEIARQQGFDLDVETLRRALLAQKMKDLNIQVSETTIAQEVAMFFRDQKTKVVNLNAYQNFIKQTLGAQELTEADFVRFMRHEVGIRYLTAIYGMSGELVAPRSAETAYRRDNERAVTVGTFFSASNYLAKVVVKTNELAEYFDKHQAEYSIPLRVQLSYVSFEMINYLGEAGKLMAQNTNLNQQIEQVYLSRGTNAMLDASGKPLPEAQAKDKIKDIFREQEALRLARKKANEFANAIYEKETPVLADFNTAATAKNLTVKETEPFSLVDGPKENWLSPEAANNAFNLTEAQPFTAPVVSTNGVYVVAFKRKFNSEPQPLHKVLAKVTEDFRRAKSLDLSRSEGAAFHEKAVKGVAAGKSFEEVCKAEKIMPVAVGAVTRTAHSVAELPETIEPQRYLKAVFDTDAGKVSPFINSGEGGFLVFVKQRLPADEKALKTELPSYLERLREARQNRAFNEWLQREFDAAVSMPVKTAVGK